MDFGKSELGEGTLSELNFYFKVLVVEDDDIAFILMEEVLASYPVQLIRAHDGEEAVDLFKSDKYAFDLILMDIRLPKLNGYDTTSAIKAINPSIPVIAVTACAHSQGVMDCFECGCDDFVAKPFDINKITRKIENYLVVRN